MEREGFSSDQVDGVLGQLLYGVAVFHAESCEWLIDADLSQQFPGGWGSESPGMGFGPVWSPTFHCGSAGPGGEKAGGSSIVAFPVRGHPVFRRPDGRICPPPPPSLPPDSENWLD